MGTPDGENAFDFGPPEEPDIDYPEGEVSGERFPPPNEPLRVARQLEPEWKHDGQLALRHWRGQWMQWRQTHWVEIDAKDIRSRLYERMENAFFVVVKDGKVETKPWAPTKSKMADLLEASAAIVHLGTDTDPPAWIGEIPQSGETPIVACRNGLLDLDTRQLLPLTPSFYNLVSVPFDYNPNATEPTAWLEFLDQLWPHDDEQIRALQEWMGYLVSGRVDQQKIMLIVGPTRSGKGTIARVIAALMGKGNIAGPTLASLATNFGLQPLLGKPLAVISDARLGGKDKHLVTERLLTISGEDTITVDRKFRDPYTGKMPTRIMILSNELPSFGDSSGVIVHRLITLSLTRSFLGREDVELTEKLTRELPGILNWALAGLDRLNAAGRFTEPAASLEAVMTMKDDASPMSAFVRDRCTIGAGLEVDVDELWKSWREWCLENGLDKKIGSKQLFGRDLRSVAPSVRMVRPRDGEDRKRVYRGIDVGRHNVDDESDDDAPYVRNGHESEAVVRDGPHEKPLHAYARAGTATPAMANIADHRGPSGPCQNRRHTPYRRGVAWHCDECNPPVPEEPPVEHDPWGQFDVDPIDAESTI